MSDGEICPGFPHTLVIHVELSRVLRLQQRIHYRVEYSQLFSEIPYFNCLKKKTKICFRCPSLKQMQLQCQDETLSSFKYIFQWAMKKIGVELNSILLNKSCSKGCGRINLCPYFRFFSICSNVEKVDWLARYALCDIFSVASRISGVPAVVRVILR